MRLPVLLIALLLTLPLALPREARAQQGSQRMEFVELLWSKAVEQYQQQDYEAALGQFERLLEQTRPHPRLYFNIGNCYLRLNQPGLAVWAYEKALQLDPRHADARRNLDILRYRAGLSPEAPPLLLRPPRALYHFLTAGEWFAVWTFWLWLACLGALVWMIAPALSRPRRVAQIACLSAVVLAVLSLGFALPRYYHAERMSEAVVIAGDEVVRAEPRADAEAYYEAPAGRKLHVLGGGAPGWTRVKNPEDGRTGFLPEASLRAL